MNDRALAGRITALADQLARRSTERMYEDPFWEARFGARGRRFADEDGRHHVDHLVLALQVGDVGPLAQYVRWLRVVLTTRGMCSRHIEQNLSRVADAIDEAQIEGAERARAQLEEAARALRPETAAASALFDARAAIAAGARRRFDLAHPGRATPAGDPRGGTDDDLSTLVSFLTDAVALDRPDLFAKHVAWLAPWLASRGHHPQYVAALLEAMEGALDDAVPGEAARAAGRAVLGASRAAPS